MSELEWEDSECRAFGVLYDGTCVDDLDDDGNQIESNTLLFLLNSHWHDVPFTLPLYQTEHDWKPFAPHAARARWKRLIDSSTNEKDDFHEMESGFNVPGRSMVLFALDHGDSRT